MVVRYKGKKYKCRFKDKFAIMAIKIKLRIIRLIRLCKIIFPKSDVLLYMMIVCLWLTFAWISNFMVYQRNQVQEPYLSTLWKLKNSVFSSVVIAFAIGSFNHVKEYKVMIKRQHYIYVDSMDDFEKIIEAVYDSCIWLMFHSMYNEQCLEKSIDYLKDKRININNKEFAISIDAASERISMVEQELKMGRLLVQNEMMMNLYLSEAKKLISRFMFSKDRNDFEKLLNELFKILNQLRFPWRRDEKNDSKIISILDKESVNCIRNDFYKRMFLSDFELEFLEK